MRSGTVKKIRRRIYEIIEIAADNDIASRIYDIISMAVILISVIPLAFTENYPVFDTIHSIVLPLFIADYLLHFITADMKLKKGNLSFLLYPFSPMAIIDLLCILSLLPVANSALRVLTVFRFVRTFRVIKALRYSPAVRLFVKVFKEEKQAFGMVAAIAVLYILVVALVMLNVEPETFGNYLNAVYWAAVTLTTVGFGDFSPVTVIGKIITILSALVGVAIVAMPTGIIAFGLLREVGKKTDDDPDNDNEPYQKTRDRFIT